MSPDLPRVPILGFLAAALIATTSTAQTITYSGDRGSGCAAIPQSGGSHTVTLTGAIPPGATVLVSAGTTQNATFSGVTDSVGGNTYVSDNSRLGDTGFRVFAVSGRISNGLAGGQAITLNYSAAAVGGETSCAVVSVFANVTSALPRTDQLASNAGTSTSPAVTFSNPTVQPNELIHVAFATAAATGGFSIPVPFQPLSAACQTPFCVFPAYRIVGATGTYGSTATSTNSVPWAAVLSSYLDQAFPVELQRLEIE